jgi:hypothetical protein
MAKRQRGGQRPGQRAPLQRGSSSAAKPAAKPVPAPAPRPSGTLSDDELARAEELEARIVAEERAAASSTSRGRDRRRTDVAPPTRARVGGSLTATAEEEYQYARRDLRRIAVVFSGIFALLIASWVVIIGAGLVKV